MRTFYCQAPSCGHHVDRWLEPPQRCPTCGRRTEWGMEPPELDERLTVEDRQLLKAHAEKVQ